MVTAFRKVLIANRGEIAVRVMRTCHELGIRCVAVYSEADRAALHVRHADEAYLIGPPPARESYLVIDKILDVAQRAGVDAIHPGYGFLSENAEFAAACRTAGVVFIGPPPEAIRDMADKTTARAKLAAAGVPVVPGRSGPGGRGFATAAEALAAAREIGFPVMLKAAAGGGGKGMRLVDGEAKLAAAFQGARREAQSAFGDDAIYLEKAVVQPRHVEVQVFADAHGHALHLGERDCSVQRRHQKVIEETPSPVVDEPMRARMGDVAVKAARAVGYQGAGTIEFLVDQDRNFYFLEMNTRLQVEHPVTELCTGLDLVRLQIQVAEGEPLELRQEQVVRRGAALECRIYAEDPVRFFPSPGRITRLETPSGPYVRDDSGVYAGAEISVYYDPLISKLATWADTRERALERMLRALSEYVIRGIKTNIPFHQRVLRHPAFRRGEYDTSFIERYQADLTGPTEIPADLATVAVVAAAVDAACHDAAGRGAETHGPPGRTPDARGGGAWRNGVRWRGR
ncbi:MAG: acetyl-CoA carboxylase biotin carboxylase subunit [Deltaproteobacteria bacterium]|nr:acetyl-CoA carboxylase biotin carboxylase subunit [Deltaproteobacteria bacterium]